MTPLTMFYVTLRVLLGDLDPQVFAYPDLTLANTLKSVILMNRAPGYALTPDGGSITPDVLASPNANDFATIIYQAVKLLIMNIPERYAYKTRGVSESFGSQKNFLLNVEMELWKLLNGSPAVYWQSYHAWVAGMAGLPVGLVLTNVNVKAPFFTANVSTAGVTIAPASPVN